jgi:arylsulfatase A-like enzyme
LQQLKANGKPFFLSVGYYKPHLPFNAPKKYWDLYDKNKIQLTDNQYMPKGSPVFAVHGDQELRSYDDFKDLPKPTDGMLSETRQRELLHGYYACVSYIDAQIGRLVDALEALGLAENTVIVLWGDHGWKLGEHNSWAKQSNYEIDTRVPLIVSGKGIKAKGQKSASLVEFVDIFPTLCDLAGLEIPTNLAGKSLVSVMKKPATIVKEYAVSQYPRSNGGTETDRSGYADSKVMGYSIRNQQYRFTLWMGNNYRSSQPFNKDYIIGTELYDYKNDPLEKVNVAKESKYTKVSKKMYQQIIDFFKSQQKQ